MAVIASRKMKRLVQDISLIEAALRTSSQLVVSSDGKKVKRLHALLDIDIEDAKANLLGFNGFNAHQAHQNRDQPYSSRLVEVLPWPLLCFLHKGNERNFSLKCTGSNCSRDSGLSIVVQATTLHHLITSPVKEKA